MLACLDDLRDRARSHLPRFVFDYLEGGAEDESGLRRNLQALEHTLLLPRALRDTAQVESAIDVFGERWARPYAIAPTGFNALYRPGGDAMLARAAGRAGVPFCLSTASNMRLEAVRGQADASLWLQLYVMSDRGIAEHMLARARAAGYKVLVLTVDVAVSGRRPRDLRNGFRVPFKPSLRLAADLCRHPAWSLRQLFAPMPDFANLAAEQGARLSAQAQAALLARAMDRSLAWQDFAWLRRHWAGPLVVKGLLHPEDARQAVAAGADGVIVSNHGGRQLAAAPAAISQLPAVLDAVAARVPVFVDGGFRSGADIAKALALGATAVFLGRPFLYGLAAAGEAGVDAVFDFLAQDLERAMILCGARSPAELRGLAGLPPAATGFPGGAWVPAAPMSPPAAAQPLLRERARSA